MWTSSYNTKSQPKQKSIAARATLSGFGTNLTYNRSKLETTKFIVTLKPVRKQRGEESGKSPTTSKECCRCDEKIIKDHDKIQVKADDILKGKTILNAFRLLANSKFISIDKSYEPTDAKILLPPTKSIQHSTESTDQKNDVKSSEDKSNHSRKLETKEHMLFKTRAPRKSSSDKSNQANLCSDSNLENLKKMIIERIRKSQEIKIRDDMRKRDSKLKSCEEHQKRENSQNRNEQNTNEQSQRQEQVEIESPGQQSSNQSQNLSPEECQEENQNINPSTNQNQKSNQGQKQKIQPNPKDYLTKAQNIKRNRNQIRSQSESPNPSSNRYTREQNSRNLSHNLSVNSYTIPKTVATSPSLNQYKSANLNQNLEQNPSPNQQLKLKLNHKQSKNQQQNQNENVLKAKNTNLNSNFDMKLDSKSFVTTNQNEIPNFTSQQKQNQNKIQTQQQPNQKATPIPHTILSPNHSSSPTIKPIIKPFPYLTKSKNQNPCQNKNLSQTPVKSQNQNQKQNPPRNRNQNQNKNQTQNPCENVRHNQNKSQIQENQNKSSTPKNQPTQKQYENLKQRQILREKQNQNQDKNQTENEYENPAEYPNRGENQTQSPYTNLEEYHNPGRNQYQSQDNNQFSNIQSEERIVPNTRMNDNPTYDITPTSGNSSDNNSPGDAATDDDNGNGDDDDNGVSDADADDDDDKDRLTGGNDNKRSRSPRGSLTRRRSVRESLTDPGRDSFRSALEELPATNPPSQPMTRRECFRNLYGYPPSPARSRERERERERERDLEPLPKEEKRKSKGKDGKVGKDKKDGKDGKEKSKRGSWFGQKKKNDDPPVKSSTGATRRRGQMEESVSQDQYSSKRVVIGERCCDRACAYRKAVSRQQGFANQYGSLGCDRIELLENQLEQLRLELGGIRSDVMPNDGDNTRFTALDKRLLELNFLINDMKKNCGGEFSRLPQSSQYPLLSARSSLAQQSKVEQPPPSQEPPLQQPPLQQHRRQEIQPATHGSTASAREPYSAPPVKRGRRSTIHKKEEEDADEEIESIASEESIVIEPELPPKPFKCEVCDCNSDIDAARKLANCIFIRTKKCTCDNCDCEKYDKIKREACMLLPDPPEEVEEEYDEEELAMMAEQEALQDICRKSGIEAALAVSNCRCGEEGRPTRKDCETETVNTEDKDTCTEDTPLDDTDHGYKSNINDNNNDKNNYYDNYGSGNYGGRNSGSIGRNSASNGHTSGNYGRARDDPFLGQGNSFCRYCNNSNYPVIDNNDLCVEVMRRLGQHCVNEIALTILLQSNGLYHINIAVISTGEHIACLYATELAIRCANQTNFFEDIMTFFIVDARNTHSQKNQILKHTFEFVDDDRK